MAGEETAEVLTMFGVDGKTGALAKLAIDAAVEHVRGNLSRPLVDELAEIHGGPINFAPNADVNAWAMEEVGWGLVFPAAVDADAKARRAEIVEAMSPLLELRRSEVGERFKVLDWAKTESREQFLGKYDQPTGPIDPDKVPYHQLVIAGPDAITFDQQFSLDVPASVGRLWFDELDSDDPAVRKIGLDALDRYARMVRDLETTKQYPRERVMRFLGTANGDPATASSSSRLVPKLGTVKAKDWTVDAPSIGAGAATRAAFAAHFGGDKTPAILFTASHGIDFGAGDENQRRWQGAPICQEWDWFDGAPSRDHLFTAEDVSADANVAGMIAFLFACHGAGTPVDNQFGKVLGHPATLAKKPFVAALPNRLLSHEKGPALAVLGHVERAFESSFLLDGVDQLSHYQSTLRGLAKGQRVGHAMENFSQRFSDLATILVREINRMDAGVPTKAAIARVVALWTVAHDARNYILLGDPAARIPPINA
jgi:hypothetical protein